MHVRLIADREWMETKQLFIDTFVNAGSARAARYMLGIPSF